MYLRPTCRKLDESPPKPTIGELPDSVIDRMVKKDKAFWVDPPGKNAYVLHDAYYRYGMTTEKILPPHQDVFPRSYQYDLDCVKFRRYHACDGLKQTEGEKKPVSVHCRDCRRMKVPGLTPFQLAWAQDAGQKRWRNYPDLTAKNTKEEIQKMMVEVGRPYRHEACSWYNENYPSVKYDFIIRKFSK
ncbi:uncharacterized protein LOC126379863 isoform X2 [Pectinophora gossypiella]|nr:uncharacterized protein LOC126379863 isoform X2 [Pectinophora gossypiella]XP_049884789.1 uncharacterized protein LOC126379863 isoform X2 [Pectinophora gossypiella]